MLRARASISQDYWGDIKEDWGSGYVIRVQGWSPGRGSWDKVPQGGLGDEVPHKLKLFL